MQEMAHAMTDVRRITEQNNEKFVWDYYTEGTTLKSKVKDPKNANRSIYERTFTLPKSSYTTPLRFNGSEITFESSYDESRVNWHTGTFTPFEVISATEFHEFRVKGKSHYFERLEEEINPTINRVFKSKGFI